MKDGNYNYSQEDPRPQDAPFLLNAAIQHGARLIGHELRLLRFEMKQKAASALGGIAMILVAVVLVLSALDVLTAAAVAALVELGLAVSLASLAVGGFALVVAAGLFIAGRSRLRPENLSPERSVENLRRDIETLKERANV